MGFHFLFTSDAGESLLSLQLSTGLGLDFSLPDNFPPEANFHLSLCAASCKS